ncbi:MAG: endonuclease/exonuclease/phosphatase family protein [Proteobacteria bacterium]|nr:endonuclease/exonuclease/phosphatase family protein [Pseudomonadota bacterium]
MSRRLLTVCICVMGCVLGSCTEVRPEGQLYVSPETSVQMAENGGTTQYVVKLNTEPVAPVTVSVLSPMPQAVSAVTESVVIRPDQWGMAWTIPVSCHDNATTGDQDVTVSFVASSLDPDYNNLVVTRDITCLDDDASDEPGEPNDGKDPGDHSNPGDNQDPGDNPIDRPGHDFERVSILKVAPQSGLVTTEDGGEAQFAVVLTQRVKSPVAVSVRSLDITEGIVSPHELLFTSLDWNRPQIVTVTGQDDNDDDGDVAYGIEVLPIAADNELDDAASVIVSVINKDTETVELIPDGTPGVLVSPVGGLETSEKGKTANFEVVLKGEPTASVTIPVVSSNPKEGKVSVNQLVFKRETWNQKQSVTITGVDDQVSDGDVDYVIQLGPVQSSDSRYAGMPVSSVAVTNLDNDPPDIPASFKVSATSLQIEESGAHGVFTVAPGTKPIAPVTVTMTVTDTTEGQIKPSVLTFTEQDWETAQNIEVFGVVDGVEDGTQHFRVEFQVASTDPRFNGYQIAPIQVTCTDSDIHTGESVKIRAMAANITSGNYQSYSEGPGIRIFQAVKPDIVLIQEFNMYSANDTSADIRKLVDTAFGSEFYYYHGNGSIPNGIISRYPILESGYWTSNVVSNRNWDWAVIDLPGPKELLAVSVHLHTDNNAREMPELMKRIQNKIDSGKAVGQNYFLLLGGDFNTKSRSAVVSNMSDLFETEGPYPEDQNGETGTSTKRDHPYDWLLCSPDWCAKEVPVEIGAHTGADGYPNGHVFDSRVYADTKVGSTTELEYVPPVKAEDSGAFQMQHMAVIRDFYYSY